MVDFLSSYLKDLHNRMVLIYDIRREIVNSSGQNYVSVIQQNSKIARQPTFSQDAHSKLQIYIESDTITIVAEAALNQMQHNE